MSGRDRRPGAPTGITSGEGRPTAPIAFERAPDDLSVRFSPGQPLDEALLGRLAEAAAVVDTSAWACVEAGRDWWPLTIAWATEDVVPSRPAAVVRPCDAAEVAAVLSVCDQAGVPVTAAGGRSGVCGASIPAFGGVALDLTGLTGLVEVDDQALSVTVRPGTFGDRLEAELREAHGLTLGHWPQSVSMSTVGGWLACRSAGQYSTRYGKIEDMVTGLEVALADGRLIHTGTNGPRAATGPDLTQLFVGSEGTLGIITEARLRAHPLPDREHRAAWTFESFAEGLDACRRVMRRGVTPAVLRLYDPVESKRSFDVRSGCALIVLDEGDPALVSAGMAAVAEECTMASPQDEELVARWLEHRNQVPPLESLVRGGLVVDTVDVAASWSALPSVYSRSLEALRALEDTVAASAHLSHAYVDGACLYFTFAGQVPPGAPAAGEAYYRAAWEAIMRSVLEHGAAISHHHGIGINRGRYLPAALGGGFDVLAAVKRALDPHGILNPGKLGLPSPFGDPLWP